MELALNLYDPYIVGMSTVYRFSDTHIKLVINGLFICDLYSKKKKKLMRIFLYRNLYGHANLLYKLIGS